LLNVRSDDATSNIRLRWFPTRFYGCLRSRCALSGITQPRVIPDLIHRRPDRRLWQYGRQAAILGRILCCPVTASFRTRRSWTFACLPHAYQPYQTPRALFMYQSNHRDQATKH
jgi:hypothetical protein